MRNSKYHLPEITEMSAVLPQLLAKKVKGRKSQFKNWDKKEDFYPIYDQTVPTRIATQKGAFSVCSTFPETLTCPLAAYTPWEKQENHKLT